MAKNLSAQAGVDNADVNFVNGKVVDGVTLDGAGINQDIIQIWQKLMNKAGIVANGSEDNEANGYQFLEALQAEIVSAAHQSTTAAFTITSPSGTIVSAYKRLARSGNVYVLQTEFTINGGGATNPVFSFGTAVGGAIINSEVIGWDDQNGFEFFKVTGSTPLELTMQGGISAGIKTIKLSVSFATS